MNGPHRVYHPYFVPMVQRLDAVRQAFETGTATPVQVWRSLIDWLQDFMARVQRWESHYLIEWENTPTWLMPDEVPLAEALEMVVHTIDRLREAMESLPTDDDLWERWGETLLDLMPWVVWGGHATHWWYRAFLASYRLHPKRGERLLAALYKAGQRTDREDIRLLVRGALDYFRIRREREGG